MALSAYCTKYSRDIDFAYTYVLTDKGNKTCKKNNNKQEMLQYVTNAPEGPLN